MDSKNEPFEVEFTNECIEEMIEIYEYISYKLKENNAAKRLMAMVTDKIIETYKYARIIYENWK